MDALNFLRYLDSPCVGSIPALKELMRKYPFSSVLHILYAKLMKENEPESDTSKHIEMAAIYMNDRKKLFRYLNNIHDDIVVHHPVSYYKLENTGYDTESSEGQNDLISKFLNKQPVFIMKKDVYNEEEEPVCDTEIISETMAEIYINQGKTDKAVTVYEKLSLKCPEKSSYFAARIEKIKKV